MQGVFPTTEAAMAAIATTAISASTYVGSGPVQVFTGTDNDDKAAPAVICWAEAATEDYPLGGIWHVKAHVITKEVAAESSPSTVDTFIGDIQSAFLTSSIEKDLSNAVSNYFVYQVVFDSNNSTTDGDAWIHTLGLDIVCTIKE